MKRQIMMLQDPPHKLHCCALWC